MAVDEAIAERVSEHHASRPRRRTRLWPLAPIVYLARNAGRSIPLTAVIMLAVLLMSGIIGLIDSIPYSVRMTYRYTQEMLGMGPRGDPSETGRIIKEIKRKSPVILERVMRCRASSAEVVSIVGHWPFAMLGLGQDDMRFYLKRMHASHIEGRLPVPGAAEAIVSRPVATNLGLTIYDPKASHKLNEKSIVLGPDKSDDYSPQYVHVVGIADTDEWLMLNTIEYQRSYHFPPIDLALVFAYNRPDQQKLDSWAEKHFQGWHAQAFTYHQVEKETKDMFNTLYTIIDVVVVSLAIVITCMMGMLMNIYQTQRLVEFGLLQAMGYTRSKLLWRVFRETAIVVITGWLAGLVVAGGLLRVADRILMAPHAFSIQPFDPIAFRYTLPLPMAILVVAWITVWWRFNRFDPVAIVERRLL